jgi:integrase
MKTKPQKPYPDFPLGPASNGQWCKKIDGKLRYFGKWDNPEAALAKYLAEVKGDKPKVASTQKSGKPAKPWKGYPLTAHGRGQWVKRVKGKLHSFGPWSDPQAALDKWLRDKDALLAGREPKADNPGGLTVGVLVNHFLNTRQSRVASGEIKQRTVKDYKLTANRIAQVFGKGRLVEDLGPQDFEKLRASFAKTHGPVQLGVDITRAKVIFGYGVETFEVRVRYGKGFRKPSKSVLRRDRASKPAKFFENYQIQTILAEATKPLKAMILLGINCGFGNNDCATIGMNALDLEGGWHNYARPKTGIARRCPLWPETVDALKEYLAERPQPRNKENAARVFITNNGNTWEKTDDDNPISKEMAKLLKRVGLHEKGRNFYSLRHTFQTIGDRSGQMVAVKYVMGHAPSSDDMAAIYREHTFEENIVAASDYVRAWTFKRTQSSPLPVPATKVLESVSDEPSPSGGARKPRTSRRKRDSAAAAQAS